ncbi:MAG: TetR family transcriptional regulator [Cystobacter sp.]
MARNEHRRAQLADAGIELLAETGARGLTHRAVDARAGVPLGTASNYFPSRQALIEALVTRIGERLTPDPSVQARLSSHEPSRRVFADYVRDIIARLTTHRAVTLALFELRLESARNPEVAALMAGWQRSGFEGDVAFNKAAGLPGDKREIALFHYAIDGLIFDRLTQPIDGATSTDEVVDALVEGLLRD